MIMRMMNIADFDETSIEIIGDNSQYSKKSSNENNREVVLKFAAKHQDIRAVGIMLKESVGLGLQLLQDCLVLLEAAKTFTNC